MAAGLLFPVALAVCAPRAQAQVTATETLVNSFTQDGGSAPGAALMQGGRVLPRLCQPGHCFYTSPSFPFPFLYDFNLNTVLYYYPGPSNAGHYNTNGVRYFYDFASGSIITQ